MATVDPIISLSSQEAQKTTWQRTAVMLAAWLEVIVGVSFILAVNTQSQFIFGATPEGAGVHWARFSGIALIALGIACMPSKLAGMRQVQALLVFNIAVTIFFAWVALATTFRGVLLWAVVILHAVVATALALSLRNDGS